MPPLDPDLQQQRETALQCWFSAQLPGLNHGLQSGSLLAVSGDASFRRYFRASTGKGSLILVDAPPPHEDCTAFVKVAALFAQGSVGVPQVLAADLVHGYMCLEDLGTTLLWTPLEQARQPMQLDIAGSLYQGAFDQLLLIQQLPIPDSLPWYNTKLLQRELDLFSQWFCGGLLLLELQAQEQHLLDQLNRILIENALAQPQTVVHRDFHSRNLMYRPGQPLGVIDFQDAVIGPLTYDLVSLLRDCYIHWPEAQVYQWLKHYREQALEKAIVVPELAGFCQDFDFMGLQRHLKVLGIFSRLWLRDGKAGYLKDIPLTYQYVTGVLAKYPQFAPMHDWLTTRVTPVLAAALARAGRDAQA